MINKENFKEDQENPLLEPGNEWWRKYEVAVDNPSPGWKEIRNNTVPTPELEAGIGTIVVGLPIERGNLYMAYIELLYYRTQGLLPYPDQENAPFDGEGFKRG